MKLLIVFLFISNIFASELTEMQNACKQSIAEACYELAMIYSGKDGLKPNPKKLKKYYDKACNLDHDKACLALDKLIQNK